MTLWCSYCDIETPGDSGYIACRLCGIVLSEADLVDDVQYINGSDGQEMKLYCNYCEEDTPGKLCDDSGSNACRTCGNIIMEVDLEDDAQYFQESDGQSRMQGVSVESSEQNGDASASASMETEGERLRRL